MRLLILALLFVTTSARSQTPPRKQAVEDLRLDASTEDFPDISTVMVGSRGQMIVFVSNDQQLRVYDATGKKTATFGRKGSGPGEFQRAIRFGWTGDTLWAYDSDQRRVTYMAPTPALIRTEVLAGSLNQFTAGGRGSERPGVGAIMSFSPSAVVSGKYVGTALVHAGPGRGGTVNTSTRIMSVTVRAATGADSTGAGRAFLGDGPNTTGASVGYQPGDGSSYSAAVPFTFYPTVVYSPDGSRLGVITTEVGDKGGTFTIVMLSTKGDTIYRRAYPFAGTPIPSSVSDSALNAIGVSSDGKPFFPPAVQAKLREAMQPRMPKVYQPVSSMVIGSDGTTWVSTRATPQGRSVYAIDARGNHTFTVDLPPRTRLVQANRTTLWTVQTDADDLPSVVRYRIK